LANSDDDAVRREVDVHALITRRFYAEGSLWLVREVRAPSFDRRGGTHLLFESDNVMRRLRIFPVNWYDLGDDELYALSQRIRQP
jgi:hypothetical protein